MRAGQGNDSEWGAVELDANATSTPSRRDRRPSGKPGARSASRANPSRSGSGRGPRRAGMGCVAAAIATVLVLILGTAGVVWVLVGSANTDSTAEAGSPVTVVIPQGSGTAAIAAVLTDAGVVDNALVFRIKSRLDGADGTYLAGTYSLTAHMGYDAAIAALQKGPRTDFVSITFPEGLTIHLMATMVENELGIPYAEFSELAKTGAPQFEADYPFLAGAYGGSLEGFLFPDTYQFDKDATSEEVLRMMLDQFDQVWASLDKPADRLDRYSTSELVTIASMVEREAQLDDERPLVASVVDNRLAKGMKLQFCSTVQFLLPGEEERTKVRLTNADIGIQSPYNTYLNPGLPPGPIANPGREALNAALHPADTTYLYFVLTGTDGSQTFATTSAEFERAKAKSKEVLGQ